MPLDDTVLAADRHAWEIADVLVRAGELVEEGGLAAVLLSRQGKGEYLALGQGMLVLPGMETPAFTQTGMGIVLVEGQIVAEIFIDRPESLLFLSRFLVNLDFQGLGKPECQGITVDPDLHRIAHRGHLDQAHLGARDDAHIQEMLAKRAFASNLSDDGGLAYLQVFECHRVNTALSDGKVTVNLGKSHPYL